MYKIVEKTNLNDTTGKIVVEAPLIAEKARPGQFIILRVNANSERVPFTIAETDSDKGTVSVIFQIVGKSTDDMDRLKSGDYIEDFVGPLGRPSELDGYEGKRVAVIGGGLGVAIAYPQAKYLHDTGAIVDMIVGFRNTDIIILEEEMRAASTNYLLITDDGSSGRKGFVTDVLKDQIDSGVDYDLVIAVGPLIMMKNVCELTKPYNIKTVVSMNTVMIDGTGMCGCCRLTYDGEMKFACIDGPDFDGHKVDFDEAMERNSQFKQEEKRSRDRDCNLFKQADEKEREKPERNNSKTKVPMPEQDPKERGKNFKEVALGYTEEMAVEEARRCLNCKHKPCVDGCPVRVRIPEFIEKVVEGDFEEAYQIITSTNNLPAICGRVCPQESQCEARCVRGIKGEPVAIGRLERFVADWHMKNTESKPVEIEKNGKKVAVIGAGPSGLTCAGDLAKEGYDVTIFEALHLAGGVLSYGIPEFRLPKELVQKEIQNVQNMGVDIETNMVIGRVLSVDELMDRGFDAVYVGTGAGLPKFMGIKGENLKGVYSSNEFLTRINLMKAYTFPENDTPIKVGKRVAVCGGGNVAMDAARSALRLGAEEVYIVYRRSEEEMPARLEEVHHAKEEGIIFKNLNNPVEIIGDDEGNVKALRLIRMELGEEDSSGRRRPIAIEGSEYEVPIDTVIMAIGNSPNPLIKNTTPEIDAQAWGGLIADEETGATTKEGVYAGGDAVTGAATVILAMGAGKDAAKAIDKYLKEK